MWIWAFVLLLAVELQDARSGAGEAAYKYAWRLFLRGQLIEAQKEAERGENQFEASAPTWAAKLRMLEAQILLRSGTPSHALQVLSATTGDNREEVIQKLTLESIALTRLQRSTDAEERLKQAERLCKGASSVACGGVLRARGVEDVAIGQFDLGKRTLLESLSVAGIQDDQFLRTTTLLNLSWAALQNDLFDEAVDWSLATQRAAADLGAEDLADAASGNLGWAYFELGDHDRALQLFLDAESRAAQLGDSRSRLRWLENIGNIYQTDGQWAQAGPVYRQALELAQRNDDKDDIAITLEDLAFASIDAGKLDEADSYLAQLEPLIRSSGDHGAELWVDVARGQIAALRRDDRHAETLLHLVLRDADSQTSMKLEAGRQLARLDESEGRAKEADNDYQSTLATFETARNELKKDDSRLPFLANAADLYGDYIHFLVQQGKSLQALAVADQSRARTLEEGLRIAGGASALRSGAFDPRGLSVETRSTLLFYWLGESQSYLWAVTPAKVALFRLPARKQIEERVAGYRKTLLDLRDPLETKNADGQALYQMLVAPAAALIQSNKSVIVLDEGALSKLNFETLLAPGAGPIDQQTENGPAQLHYLLDDLTLSSAPSLATLAATKPASDSQQGMLLIGNPVSPDREFPSLPLFSFEISRVGDHFASKHVISGPQATPAAYVASRPEQYSYLHFVSHAVASSVSPLDSAIILSNTAGQEDSYKLYAREIIQHPIRAKLVTISACYGSGVRSYAGEGLVGLSWAFLRAGAHKVIGALWEVSDNSTPRLMDSLYQGLENGQSPESALHNAKLTLLHSKTRAHIPFYWAPFQIYGGR